MGKRQNSKSIQTIRFGSIKIDIHALRRKRTENLKQMIHNEDYMNEAITKLANSLTSGLMK